MAPTSQERLIIMVQRKNQAWKGMISIGNHKRKTDAWVELHGGIWRWRTGGKYAYKRNANHLVGDPYFIVKIKYVRRGVDISWWVL